jgi:hypothetical protein
MAVNTLFAIGIGTAIFVALLTLLDLLFAGGAGTAGLRRDAAAAMNNPITRAILLVGIIILGVFIYAVFFR